MRRVSSRVQRAFLLLVLTGGAVWIAHPVILRAQSQSMGAPRFSFASRWFAKNGATAVYVGPKACAECHSDKTDVQPGTAMGKALEPVSTCGILKAHARLTFHSGRYSWTITRKGDESIYSVTDGADSLSEPILYAFGQGKAGQTYVFKHDGSFYESRVSFYKDTDNLDWTMGYPSTVPISLNNAAGRAISPDETRSCFGCHSTASVSGQQLQLNHLIPGVSCEACHGPGSEHIAAMKAGNLEEKHIFNPESLDPDDLGQEFCGSCHRSAETVTSNTKLRGVLNVRFQPYRLFTSGSHDPSDPRLSCVACHDPHENPRHDAAYYDSKCFACHRSTLALKPAGAATAAGTNDTGQQPTAKPCPVAQKDCITCHMPKVEIPGSHYKFTDHRIRIVREGEPFPN